VKVIPLAIVAGVAAGVLSVGLATSSPTRPKIFGEAWSITRSDGKTITPDRPLELPRRYGDFDLNCRLELPENADLDLLFRKVEHWGEGHLPLFHARFSGIRVSTRKDGPGFLTREQVLFDPDAGGIRVSPGLPTSLELSCRGNRVIRANVNGIDLPNITTTDDFGNLALVSRNGVAIVHDFQVTPWPASPSFLAWFVGAGAGAVLGLLLGVFGASAVAIISSLLVFGAGGFLATWLVLDNLLPAVTPSPEGVAWGALCLFPGALVLGFKALKFGPRLVVALLVGVAGAGAVLEMAARSEGDNFAVFEDDRLDLVFGPQSGATPFHAVARMLKCQYTAHMLTANRYDVLLLGGKQFFDFNDIGGHGRNVNAALPVLVKAKLRLPPKKEPTCAAIPSEQPNAYQQFALFADYYKDYRPRVVVLGLSGDEDDAHTILRASPREFAKIAGKPRDSSGSVLLDIYRRSRPPETKPQTVDDLRATLQDLHAVCQSVDSKLVLAIDRSLSKDFQKVALAFATDQKVPFVTGFAVYEGHYPVEQLAEVVVRELIR
jgi:hypothetical protein